MNLPDALLPDNWYGAGHLIYGILLVWVLRQAPWARLKDPARLNLWLGTMVALLAVWSIKTGIKPGLNFHLLGATAATLMFGPWLAIAGLSLVLVGVTLAGAAGWQGFSLNAVFMIAVPVLISHLIYRTVDRNLPNHFFIYIFANAFFGAALAMGAAGLASTALFAWSDTYPAAYLTQEYLPYYTLMGWSEAMTTGMAITLMVVYRPDWVSTFDDGRYLRGK